MRDALLYGAYSGHGSHWAPLFVHVAQLRTGRVPVMRLPRLTPDNEAKARAVK